jgi:hypothetical protein
VSAVIGALIAHFAAKARGAEDHEWALDLLVTQDERSSARDALAALRDLRTRAHAGAVSVTPLLFYDAWRGQVVGPCALIRSAELNARVDAGSRVIFSATLTDDFTNYAILVGVQDVEEWLERWLRRETPHRHTFRVRMRSASSSAAKEAASPSTG